MKTLEWVVHNYPGIIVVTWIVTLLMCGGRDYVYLNRFQKVVFCAGCTVIVVIPVVTIVSALVLLILYCMFYPGAGVVVRVG